MSAPDPVVVFNPALEEFELFYRQLHPSTAEMLLEKNENDKFKNNKTVADWTAFLLAYKTASRWLQKERKERRKRARGSFVIGRLETSGVRLSHRPIIHKDGAKAAEEAQRLAEVTGKSFAVYCQYGTYAKKGSFSKLLMNARLKLGLGYVQLAEKAGLEVVLIKKLEIDNETNISLDELEKLKSVLGDFTAIEDDGEAVINVAAAAGEK
jgi:hypothetical protein